MTICGKIFIRANPFSSVLSNPMTVSLYTAATLCTHYVVRQEELIDFLIFSKRGQGRIQIYRDTLVMMCVEHHV